jgi:hypothetical protein
VHEQSIISAEFGGVPKRNCCDVSIGGCMKDVTLDEISYRCCGGLNREEACSAVSAH